MQPTKIEGVIDPLLEDTMMQTERTGNPVPLILQVEGIIVTGTLIGLEEYLRLHLRYFISEEAELNLDEQQKTKLAKERAWGAKKIQYEKATVQPTILKLKDVVLRQGMNHTTMPLWRIPADKVSGWYFGVITSEQPQYVDAEDL